MFKWLESTDPLVLTLLCLLLIPLIFGGANCSFRVSNVPKELDKKYTVVAGNQLTYKELMLEYYGVDGQGQFINKDGKKIKFYGSYTVVEE